MQGSVYRKDKFIYKTHIHRSEDKILFTGFGTFTKINNEWVHVAHKDFTLQIEEFNNEASSSKNKS